MKEFQLYKDLIKSLSPPEIKHLKRKLNVRNQLDIESKSSTLLFDAVNNNIEITLSELYDKLYLKKNEVAIRKLLQRIINKIYDVFFINDLILGDGGYEDRTKRIFLLEKRMLLVDLLRYRGLFKLSDQMLEEIIVESVKYECYEVSISALNKKRFRSSISINEKQNTLIEKQIKIIFKLLISINRCKNIYSILIHLHNKKPNQYILNSYKKGLDEINFIAKNNSCATLEYYRLLVLTQLCSLKNEDSKAVNFSLQLIELVETNVTIYSKNRLGNAYINLALFYRNLGDFTHSLFYLDKANLLLNRISQTLGITYYQFCIFYSLMGNLDKLNYYYRLSSKIDVDLNNQELVWRYHFLNSFIQFLSFKFENAKLILESIRNNSKDDFNMEFDKKLLCIMINIELGEYDECDKLIEVLGKFVTAHIEYLELENDVQCLVDLLKSLKKAGYNFDQLKQSTLDLLIVSDSILKYRNHFLIPFTPWFIAKVKNVPYDHTKAMKEMQHKIKREKLELA